MVGSAVTPFLTSQGHFVTHLVRANPGHNEVFWDPDTRQIDAEGLEGFDGVVHLASMRWPARWTKSAKQQIYDNRLRTNGVLAEALSACRHKPQVWICASGMGIYPSSGDRVLTEESPTGTDFLARLQIDGEEAAAQAGNEGIRVVNLRIPGVLGGASLKQNLGRIGDGHQWTSWIALDELAAIIEFVLVNENVNGPVNPTSPNPMRNAEFSSALSRALGRKPGMPIPAVLLKLILGEMADALILASRRMVPAALLAAGYSFRYPELERAVRHEMGKTG